MKTILGEQIENQNERYQFTWNGKSDTIRFAQKPSTGTLRPDKESSKNWDTTGNLYIEGDKLEVLKLLQKTYHNKIKMIYIDPPYNTGGDFVYKDDFKDSIKNYKEQTNQTLRTNPETSGRYHTDWLNMMYSRLMLAKNLLTDDGVIFISIDDNEVENLKKISDEVFGIENYAGLITWDKKRKGSFLSKGIISVTEYLVVFLKDRSQFVGLFGGTASSDESQPIIKRTNKISQLSFPRNLINTKLDEGVYKKGIYGDQVNPIEVIDDFEVKRNLITSEIRIKAPFIWSQMNLDDQISKGAKFVINTLNMQVRVYKHLDINDFKGFPSLIKGVEIKGTNEDAYETLEEIFGIKKIFDYSKPINYLKMLIDGACHFGKSDIILDFFSGSCSTAHAVMQLNAEDGGNRKFIMVQLPEVTDEKSEAFKAGYNNICEIGKERIRRAGEKIKNELVEKNQKAGMLENSVDPDKLDIGFKVYKLDSSNFNVFDSSSKDINNIFNHDVFLSDRSKLDILYEILLKYGVFDKPVEVLNINNKEAYSVAHGHMLVFINQEITEQDITELVALKPREVIIDERGFKTDNDKMNAVIQLEAAGVEKISTI